MAPQSRSSFHSTVTRLAATRPGSWLFSRIAHPLDRPIMRLSRGRFSLFKIFAGEKIVTLTTIGAKSGLPRTLPLIPIRDPKKPQNLALIASNWGKKANPSWYYNLKANPRAVCTYDGQESEYEAHEASGAEYDRYWNIATRVFDNYAQYEKRTERSQIPIMVLTPLES